MGGDGLFKMKKFLLGAIAFGALSFFAPFQCDPYILPKFVPVFLALIPLLLMKSNSSSDLSRSSMIVIGAFLLSLAFSKDIYYGIFGSYMFPFDSLIALLCYVLVMIATARTGVTVDSVIEIISWASIPMSVYALIQRVLLHNDPLLFGMMPASNRVFSSQGSPIFLGACLAIVIATTCYKRTGINRAAFYLAIPALLFTQTRGACLAAIVGIFVTLFYGRGGIWKSFIYVPILLIPRLIAKQSDMGRIEIWKTAVIIFKHNPISGIGPGNFYLGFRHYMTDNFVSVMKNSMTAQAHAHNEFLNVLATTGIIGILAMILFIVALVIVSRRHKALNGILACWFVLAQFNPVSHSCYIVLAMIFGSASCVKNEYSRRLSLSALALILFGLVLRLSIADYFYRQGFRNNDPLKVAIAFDHAGRYNPWEIQITARRLDALSSFALSIPDGQRRDLAETVLDISRKALVMHPTDSYAYEAYGKAILFSILLDGKDDIKQAMKQFKIAQEFAPTFDGIAIRRRGLASAMRDQKEFELAEKDLMRIKNMVGSD